MEPVNSVEPSYQEPINPEIAEKQKRSAKGIWMAFFAAIFIWNGVAVIMRTSTSYAEAENIDPSLYQYLFYIFNLIALVQFIIIWKINSGSDVFDFSKAPNPAFSKTIIKNAMAETMSIYGMILFLLGGNYMHLFGFALVSIFSMLLIYKKDFN